MTGNPFVPTGYELYPDAPLDAADHADWYADFAGNHGGSFESFRASLDAAAARETAKRPKPPPGSVEGPALRAIRWSGRLVVVEGPERCGKTTFINHCVEKLRGCRRDPTELLVVDRRAHSTTSGRGELLPADELRVSVCRHILETAEWLQDERRDRALRQLDGSSSPPDPGLAYAIMRNHLATNRIMVVLLPPTSVGTDVENLRTYHGWMGPGMIFFAERTTTSGSPELTLRPPPPNTDPLLVLRLRNLARGEAVRFVRHRLDALPRGHGLPGVADDVVQRLENLMNIETKSLGWVSLVFRKIYQQYLSRTSQPHGQPVSWITYLEITELLAQGVHEEQP